MYRNGGAAGGIGMDSRQTLEEQTPLHVGDLAAAVGLDDRPIQLTQPVSEQDHRIGPLDAPAQLVEYGDYQCPFCAQALPGVKRILSRYEYRVLFVFRHFPLVSQHPRAWRAALAAEAAGAQGQFWPMHDHLLGHLELAERLRGDALSGLNSGVLGTPTFFVNG
jgi:protein-disulfide isomerase